MAHTPGEKRLLELRGLLQDILQETDAAPPSMQSHWELPVMPPPDADGRLSSTDLLSWWFRAPREGGNPWDTYLSSGAQPASSSAQDSLASEPAATEPSPQSWDALLPLMLEPEEQLADEHAQGAVDCLYDFLHAFGSCDVAGAMRHVAEDYHTMEDDEEVDRLKMRHRLESVVDASRGWELAVSLVEAPEPLSHPYGILIAGDIQIDAYNPQTHDSSCRVERRVAVLRQGSEGEWKILSLALVDP